MLEDGDLPLPKRLDDVIEDCDAEDEIALPGLQDTPQPSAVKRTISPDLDPP